jgi:hypothetical protein
MTYDSLYDIYWLYTLLHGTTASYRLFELEGMKNALNHVGCDIPLTILESHCGAGEHKKLWPTLGVDTKQYYTVDARHGVLPKHWTPDETLRCYVEDLPKNMFKGVNLACSFFNSLSTGTANDLKTLMDYLSIMRATSSKYVYVNITRDGQEESLIESVGTEVEQQFLVPGHIRKNAKISLTCTTKYNAATLLYEYHYSNLEIVVGNKVVGRPVIKNPLTFRAWRGDVVAMCAKMVGYSEVYHFYNESNYPHNGCVFDAISDDDVRRTTDLLLVV